MTGTRRVAAFDCGTNSLRLLVADVSAHPGRRTGSLVDLQRRMEVVRLGQGVDATGVIHPEAMRRAFSVAGEYGRICRDLGVERMRFVATSASRDARNAAEFVAGIHDLLGVTPEVIDGREEAQLSFVGALAGLPATTAPCLVVDLGGGSTELVLGGHDVSASHSMDVGCVRMTERHLRDDPATPSQIASATADIDAALDAAERDVPLAQCRTLVGVAGTVTTVTAHLHGLASYQAEVIHGSAAPVSRVLAACEDLLAMSRARRAQLGFMHEGRVDVIGAGALVWSRVVRRVALRAGLTEVVTSEHDILDGIALGLAAE